MFSSIKQTALPEAALLQRFVVQGEYTDCFAASVTIDPSLPELVEAFYTTWLFKAERIILRWLLSLPSTDEEARQVARGTRDKFAAWNVEDRSDDQLLLIDVHERTGSWFMVEPRQPGGRLLFGSVVFKTEETPEGRNMRWTYRSLLRFHRLYSRALLSAARSRLLRKRAVTGPR
ncbi:MAG: hypothetical protein KJO95_06085 [Gammaproteobacteria bacterium]|nr:hypothetical protein [Gammaproteobacteria bacterium]